MIDINVEKGVLTRNPQMNLATYDLQHKQKVLEEIQHQIQGNPKLPTDKMEVYLENLSDTLVTLRNASDSIQEGSQLNITLGEIRNLYDETLATKLMMEEIRSAMSEDGLLRNDLSGNGLLRNDLSGNGLLRNDLSGNGLLRNDLSGNGLLRNDLSGGLLRNDLVEDIVSSDRKPKRDRLYKLFDQSVIKPLTIDFPPGFEDVPLSLNMLVHNFERWTNGIVKNKYDLFEQVQKAKPADMREAYLLFTRVYLDWHNLQDREAFLNEVWSLSPIYHPRFATLVTETINWKNLDGIDEFLMDMSKCSWTDEAQTIIDNFIIGLGYIRTFIDDADLIQKRWYKLAHYPLSTLSQIHDYMVLEHKLCLPDSDLEYLSRMDII